MAAKIEIYDGNPWWASTDIWVVPGNDPNGTPGFPIAGQANYVWANVHNTGTAGVNGIQVNFYWCNPATGVLRSTSNLIGVGFVDLVPGETKEVLCISPWMATVVNDGHECLVAEAISAADRLLMPLPDDFSPPSYHQVAQKNIQVIILMAQMSFFVLPLQVSAASRKGKAVNLSIEKAELPKDVQQRMFKQAGLGEKLKNQYGIVEYGLSEKGNCSNTPHIIGKHCLEFELGENTSKVGYIHLAQLEKAKAGFTVLHITETVDGKIVGGNTVIIVKK